MKVLKEKCEICKLDSDTEIVTHHITSRCKGGKDDKSNISIICANCHMKVHHGLIIVEGVFNSTEGYVLVYRNWNEESVTGFKDPDVWLYPNAEVFKLKKELI